MARFVGWFVAIGIVVLLLVGAATAVAGHTAGEREAIIDLQAKTLGVAQLRIQPAVTDSLLDGNITAVGEVGTAVRHYVLNPSVARVKIWNKDGTIVYSDEARLIGTHQPLDAAEQAALRSGAVHSKISDPSAPENRFERSEGKLREVDLRINAPNGEPLVLQVFYRYRAITTAGTHVWNRFAPFALGALALLAFLLVLVGCLLAIGLRKRSRTSAAAPDETAEGTEAVAGAAPEPETEPEPDPDPRTELVPALSLLIARSNGGGGASTLDTERVHDTIPPDISELLFRATQETLRNHDHSQPVTVRVSDRDNVASLDVIEHAGDGHVDLRALTDLVADAGGHLLVDAADDGGTRVHVEVPLQ